MECVNLVFDPDIRKYLRENNFLVLDNEPALLPNPAEAHIPEEFNFIKGLYTSLNTPPILQHID